MKSFIKTFYNRTIKNSLNKMDFVCQCFLHPRDKFVMMYKFKGNSSVWPCSQLFCLLQKRHFLWLFHKRKTKMKLRWTTVNSHCQWTIFMTLGQMPSTWVYKDHMQKMELAAVGEPCCLPSENKMMLVSNANHSNDLDLNWQSMSVH